MLTELGHLPWSLFWQLMILMVLVLAVITHDSK